MKTHRLLDIFSPPQPPITRNQQKKKKKRRKQPIYRMIRDYARLFPINQKSLACKNKKFTKINHQGRPQTARPIIS